MSDEPVFNTFRRRPYRPFYSLREFWAGLVVLLLLGGVVAWVAHRGAHPDPSLFRADEQLLTGKGKTTVIYERPLKTLAETGTTNYEPFPAAVAGDGWTVAGGVQRFAANNLYVKINGREPFYQSFGCRQLYCISLVSTARQDLTIDIELFDMGRIENAIGTLAAEIARPDAELVAGPSGFFYASQNSGFLAHGRYYARLVGADDNEAIRVKIQSLREALVAALPGDKLPWAYGLFVGQLRLNPRQVQYYPREAFGFGFADEIYAGKVTGDAEVFVSRRADAAAASELAGKFVATWRDFGKPVTAPAGVTLLHNVDAGFFDAVGTEGAFVVGVRMAATAEEALRWLAALREPVRGLPAESTPSPPLPVSEGEY